MPRPVPARQRRAPAGFFGGQVQHGERARIVLQHGAAERDRIPLGGGGDFVDEAFDDEQIVGRADAAPPAGVHAVRFVPDIVDELGRHVIGRLRRAFHRIGIEPILETGRRPARHDRRTGDAMRPADQLAIGIQPGADAVVVIGPVIVVAQYPPRASRPA